MAAVVEREYLTPPQIAKTLGVRAERVVGWIRDGKLAAVNLSDGHKLPRFRVNRADLERFLLTRAATHTTPTPPPRPAVKRGRWYG